LRLPKTARFWRLLLHRRSLFVLPLAALLGVIAILAPSGAAAPQRGHHLTPVVLFPAFHLTRLRVTVHNQTVAPACPRSGSFEDWYQNPHPSARFSQVCRDELMTLRYNPSPKLSMPRRFSDPRGVTVKVIDYGQTASAPYYRPMYRALERAGYTADRNIRVAGYDARLTPDQGGFLRRAVSLIQQTYRSNGDQPVELVGHSNGPLYAQYLLTHTSHAWRHKYIHGFTPIAGNFPGQGSLYSIVFTGLNVEKFSYPTTRANAVSSARMYLTSPATYMSAADPAVFAHREVVLKNSSTGVAYTPADYRRLFADAHLAVARRLAEYYIGFVKFRNRRDFPDVDVTAEKGSGIPTIVGAVLPNFDVGQLVKPSALLKRSGDVNQEDITNNAVRVWTTMRCYRFTLTNNPGVNHFALPVNREVLGRLIADVRRPRSRCG
jgi:lecithin-cholesterol acyltransferase